jgi:hypothetical protein
MGRWFNLWTCPVSNAKDYRFLDSLLAPNLTVLDYILSTKEVKYFYIAVESMTEVGIIVLLYKHEKDINPSYYCGYFIFCISK